MSLTTNRIIRLSPSHLDSTIAVTRRYQHFHCLSSVNVHFWETCRLRRVLLGTFHDSFFSKLTFSKVSQEQVDVLVLGDSCQFSNPKFVCLLN